MRFASACIRGTSRSTSRNRLLGEFLFEGISPGPPGQNREIVVRFDYDINGIVQVSALDRRSGRSEGIAVTASREWLSEEEKEQAMEKVAGLGRRLDRQVDALLRRAERLMTRLEAAGQSEAAEEVLSLAGDLERARLDGDTERSRVLLAGLADLIYQLEP